MKKQFRHRNVHLRMMAYRRILQRKNYNTAVKTVLIASAFLQMTAANLKAHSTTIGNMWETGDGGRKGSRKHISTYILTPGQPAGTALKAIVPGTVMSSSTTYNPLPSESSDTIRTTGEQTSTAGDSVAHNAQLENGLKDSTRAELAKERGKKESAAGTNRAAKRKGHEILTEFVCVSSGLRNTYNQDRKEFIVRLLPAQNYDSAKHGVILKRMNLSQSDVKDVTTLELIGDDGTSRRVSGSKDGSTMVWEIEIPRRDRDNFTVYVGFLDGSHQIEVPVNFDFDIGGSRSIALISMFTGIFSMTAGMISMAFSVFPLTKRRRNAK